MSENRTAVHSAVRNSIRQGGDGNEDAMSWFELDRLLLDCLGKRAMYSREIWTTSRL